MARFYLRVATLILSATLCVALQSDSSLAADLATQLNLILDQHVTARRTTVTLKVIDLASGEVLFDRGGDRLLTPASNLKIYTSACALDTFGPDHRFETTVNVAGKVNDGVLRGNLVLVGGGDAMLTSGELAKLAERVVNELGINEIRGQVVVDNSRYASSLKGPGWMWDDDPDYYNMSITPLMVDFNVLEVLLTPGDVGPTAKLKLASTYPPVKFVRQKSLGRNILATRRPFTHPIVVAKNAVLDQPEKLAITMYNPGKWVEGVLTSMLVERGVRISPPPHAVASQDKDSENLKHLGPSLADTLKHFNHVSENAVGEVLLHEIAIAKGIKKPCWEDGAKSITTWLVDNAGLEKDSFRLVDGSGLSRYNLISADSSVRRLRFMHQHTHAKSFYTALPTYEIEINGKKQQFVSAKSGGMGGVSTISGYFTTKSGKLLAFSLLANGMIGSAEPVFGLRNEVWQALAKYEPSE